MASDRCPVCDSQPRVIVAVRHAPTRRMIVELLAREHGCWETTAVDEPDGLAAAMASGQPDLIIVDAGDFPECCQRLLDAYPRERVVVIGPEPDIAYRRAALGNGAGAWLPRDEIGDALSEQMRTALGCTHGPCPPSNPRQRALLVEQASS